MLLNMHFQRYRYNFENCTCIIVNGTRIEIKHKNFQLIYKNKQLINKASASRYWPLHWKLTSVQV